MSFKDEGYFDKRPNGLSGKPSAKDNSIDSELEEILTRGFNAFYDYITEKDIIKAAHEYSEKTFYFEALQDIHAKYVSRKELEEAIEQTRWTSKDDVYTENRRQRDMALDELRAKLLPPTKGGNDE